LQASIHSEFFHHLSGYGSLSNDLANRLITNGVKRGTLVALYMDKSIEMSLSILAVHKAGGGYVPLDPEYPAERIRTIVSLAEVTLVLATRRPHKHIISVVSETGIACVSVYFNQLSSAAKPDVRPARRDDICHVLFTSGPPEHRKVFLLMSSIVNSQFTGYTSGVVLTHGSIIESVVAS
jgi:non-ribosomal peptide synthetase component F